MLQKFLYSPLILKNSSSHFLDTSQLPSAIINNLTTTILSHINQPIQLSKPRENNQKHRPSTTRPTTTTTSLHFLFSPFPHLCRGSELARSLSTTRQREEERNPLSRTRPHLPGKVGRQETSWRRYRCSSSVLRSGGGELQELPPLDIGRHSAPALTPL